MTHTFRRSASTEYYRDYLSAEPLVNKPKTNWPATVVVVILAPIFVPVLILLLLISAVVFAASYSLLYLAIWCWWLPRGKNVLFVYSESPIWRDYMLAEILPLVVHRAVVLNWSERRAWKRCSLAALAFWFFGGRKAFNPLILVFRPFSFAQKFRFWPAFREWKQGNKQALEILKVDLIRARALPS